MIVFAYTKNKKPGEIEIEKKKNDECPKKDKIISLQHIFFTSRFLCLYLTVRRGNYLILQAEWAIIKTRKIAIKEGGRER